MFSLYYDLTHFRSMNYYIIRFSQMYLKTENVFIDRKWKLYESKQIYQF